MGTAAAIALAAQSPTSLRNAIFVAARTKSSVHYVTTTSSGSVHVHMVCDVSGDRGIQRITFSRGGETGNVTVLVENRTAYVRGDAFTLHGYMLFSSSQASHYAGRWISIPHSASGYPTVAAGVTIPSLLAAIYPKGSPIRVSGAIGGREVVGVRVRGRQTGLHFTETLWASARGRPLPIEESDTASNKSRQTVVFSRWNEPVRVVAPAHATPISKVTGS
jgi:hypothetical protein